MNTLHDIGIKNASQLIIGHLNINSFRNKFEMLEEIIKDKIDIFSISETKLDSSFTSGQFVIKGCSTPFRLDRNQNGGGLLLYVREGNPCKILNEYIPEKSIEYFFVESNFRSGKWLLSCSYNPNTNSIGDCLHCFGRRMDFYSSKYDNFIVLGDLSTEDFNSFLNNFLHHTI